MSEKSEIRLDGPVIAIDDDEAQRKELQSILQAEGLHVILQESATHALRFFQNQPWNWRPGLIITDIVMDGMGGYQLIRRVQELYPNRHIPIVVISKLAGGIDIGEAETAGASAYLTKPVKEPSLISVLKQLTAKESKGMFVFRRENEVNPYQR